MDFEEIPDQFAKNGCPLADADLLSSVIKKWQLSDWEDSYRASIAGLMLENQARHFNQLSVEASLGAEWYESNYNRIKDAWKATPLTDICSVQPMIAPVGVVAFYRPKAQEVEESKDETPTIVLDITLQEIVAEASRVAFHSATYSDFSDLANEILFEEMFTRATREVLGTLLNSVQSSFTLKVSYPDSLLDTLKQASHLVHRGSQRGPANRIIGNEEMISMLGIKHESTNGLVQHVGILEQDGVEQQVYLDPLFPKNKLMTWYQGKSLLDTCLVYSPYVLCQLSHTAVNPPEDMCVDPVVRTRQKITLVREGFVALVETA
jgi:hypothetical protein